MSGLDVRDFDQVLKTDNKSSNSILKAFSGSGLDVVERTVGRWNKNVYIVGKITIYLNQI